MQTHHYRFFRHLSGKALRILSISLSELSVIGGSCVPPPSTLPPLPPPPLTLPHLTLPCSATLSVSATLPETYQLVVAWHCGAQGREVTVVSVPLHVGGDGPVPWPVVEGLVEVIYSYALPVRVIVRSDLMPPMRWNVQHLTFPHCAFETAHIPQQRVARVIWMLQIHWTIAMNIDSCRHDIRFVTAELHSRNISIMIRHRRGILIYCSFQRGGSQRSVAIQASTLARIEETKGLGAPDHRHDVLVAIKVQSTYCASPATTQPQELKPSD